MTAATSATHVLSGDVHTLHSEYPERSVRHSQHSCPAALRPELARCWEAAERSVVEGLREHSSADAYRAVHGPSGDVLCLGHGSSDNRHRYDHVFASREFTATGYAHLQGFRLNGGHHVGTVATLARGQEDEHDRQSHHGGHARPHSPLRASPPVKPKVTLG